MADSIDVLATLKLVYGIYAFIAISLISWFGYRITKPKDDNAGAKPALFWTYQVGCGEHVVFNAISNDLTYGFGIFRADHTMVAQMQVVPKSRNDLMWRFEKNGTYYIRSTEYSGPKGAKMIAQNAIVVTGCDYDDVYAVEIGEQQ